MELSSSQLTALKVMGLPVWERRADKTVDNNSTKEVVLSDDLINQLEQCSCLLLIDDDFDESANRLLQSMMFSIGLDVASYAVINPSQVSSVLKLSRSKKILIVLGESLASNVSGENWLRGSNNVVIPEQLTSIVSHSLSTLLSKPELKAETWEDLRMVRHELTQC